MTADEIIRRLRDAKRTRAQISRATGVPYGYIAKLVAGEVKNPGARHIDVLRIHFQRQDCQA